jgi:tetratricopeptide (TPR) repeat protein
MEHLVELFPVAELVGYLFPDELAIVLSPLAVIPLSSGVPPELRLAYERLSERIESDSNDVEARVHRGAVCQGLGRHAEALADLGAALRLDPEHARAWLLASEVLQSLRRFDDARTARETAIKLDSLVAS